jgi:hypothetical protein
MESKPVRSNPVTVTVRPAPAPLKPHRLQVTAFLLLDDEKPLLKESAYVQSLAPKQYVTGVDYFLCGIVENLDGEPFPGGTLVRLNVSGESWSLTFSAPATLPPVGPKGSEPVLKIAKVHFPLAGMNWVRGAIVSDDGRPTTVVKDSGEAPDGLISVGCPTIQLESALAVDLLIQLKNGLGEISKRPKGTGE